MSQCKCHKCKPVLDGIRADISPLRNTPPREMACIAATPCIDPGSVECACPAPETILQEAQRLVHGNRGADYGHPYHDYRCTGRIWGAQVERWLRTLPGFENVEIPDLPPGLAVQMMIGMKSSRACHKPKRDSHVDEAGYAECAQMIADFPVNEAR